MNFPEHFKPVSATRGHLPPQSVLAAGTGIPSTNEWASGADLLKSRALVGIGQTGAFTGQVTNVVFKLFEATDDDGSGATATTGGTIATVTAANTVAVKELPLSLIVATKYYAVGAVVTGGTSALVAGQLRLLDPQYLP